MISPHFYIKTSKKQLDLSNILFVCELTLSQIFPTMLQPRKNHELIRGNGAFRLFSHRYNFRGNIRWYDREWGRMSVNLKATWGVIKLENWTSRGRNIFNVQSNCICSSSTFTLRFVFRSDQLGATLLQKRRLTETALRRKKKKLVPIGVALLPSRP